MTNPPDANTPNPVEVMRTIRAVLVGVRPTHSAPDRRIRRELAAAWNYLNAGGDPDDLLTRCQLHGHGKPRQTP